MDNYVGKRLDGRYEIQEIVGVGGMSVVYKAYDNIDDRIVAVKILKDEFLANEEFRRRFKNESKAIAVLSHPNIVRVYDVNFGERLQYIVMEYVDGITLKEYIQQQGTVSWKDAVHFVSQILRALQHAHDKGIVHRDIKPQNIILLQNGNIKVTDFGIARFSRSDTRTMTEKAIGSVHYISPEQARGDMTDEKADIYSVGVVLYEMLTGKVPFESDSAVSVAIMQLQADPTPPTEINQAIPRGLEQITMHAMQKLSVDRYQTATEMLMDIEEIGRNPNATFDYTYFIDSQPTKYVSDFAENTGELLPTADADDPYGGNGYYEDDAPYDDYDEAYEEYPDSREKNKKMIAAISVGVLALITAVVLLVVGLSGGFSKNKVLVPDLLSKDITEVQEQYKDKFEFEIEYVDSEYKANTIIDQNPASGKKVKIMSVIHVKVAKSGETVSMPDLTEFTVEQAKAALTKLNLKNIEVKELPSETVEEGKVISTSPAAKVEMDTTEKVTLFVSSGSANSETEKVKMPDFDGLSRKDIEAIISSMKLTGGQIKTEDSALPAGTFISQSIRANTEISRDRAFTVTVSNGVKPTTTTTAPSTSESTTDTKETEPPTKSIILNFITPNIDGNPKYVVNIYYNDKEIERRTLTMDGTAQSVTVTHTQLNGKLTLRVQIADLNFAKDVDVDFDNPKSTGYSITIPAPANPET